MSKTSKIKKHEISETELSEEQFWVYVEEFSTLYKEERKKREQLEIANRELANLHKQLALQNAYLREEVQKEFDFGQIIGENLAFKKTLEQIDLISKSDSSVLIEGETGTGKELVARAIHEKSSRSQNPLIKVNCAAIPRELFESEFFGHLRGAFTGAVKDRLGRFQLADEGTLFLDEFGEIPLDLQSKLLRVLQEGQFERVGDDRTQQVDVRIIAATNRDLKEEVRQKRFREDLYYRLSVLPIHVPPLRERGGDIELLANHFLDAACRKLGLERIKLSKENIRQFMAYSWPGNIREMQNVIERAVIISTDGKLHFDLRVPDPPSFERNQPAESSVKQLLNEHRFTMANRSKESQREIILSTLEKTNWKVYGPRGAAEALNLKPTTLASRIKKLGIQKPE